MRVWPQDSQAHLGDMRESAHFETVMGNLETFLLQSIPEARCTDHGAAILRAGARSYP